METFESMAEVVVPKRSLGYMKRVYNDVKTFEYDDGMAKIHVIRSGFSDLFMIVHENCFNDQDMGKVEFANKEQLKNIYNITF